MISRGAKITIIGLGLLGGSYAKGFYNAGYRNIYGIDIDPEAISFAKKYGWICDGGDDPNIVKDSDIVISALYPQTFIDWIKEYQDLFKPGSILTDVTGIKKVVIDEINEVLRDDVEFIPCHPMAGREYKGIQFADPSLFSSANFIIIDDGNVSEKAMDVAESIAKILKFKNVVTLSSEEHDKMIGFLSQLTHVIAVSLMNVNDNSHLSDYTGDSFRDLTRIANINDKMWSELFLMNKEPLLEQIDIFIKEMETLRNMLKQDDKEGLRQKMQLSTKRRALFNKK